MNVGTGHFSYTHARRKLYKKKLQASLSSAHLELSDPLYLCLVSM